MKILITSGGTKIPIDTVRDITNMSTGTFGTKIAEECLRKGHDVLEM
jgi:phosphopantothenoylcysteine synthetase/decarboxylase